MLEKLARPFAYLATLALTASLSFAAFGTSTALAATPGTSSGQSFQPRAVTIDANRNVIGNLNTFNLNWNTSFSYTDIEPKATAANSNIYAPYFDACWYANELPTTDLTTDALSNAGQCLPIDKLSYDSENNKIIVTPTDDVSYDANKTDIELSAPLTGTDLSTVINQHVVLRFGAPDQYTRIFYYGTAATNSGAMPTYDMVGSGLQFVGVDNGSKKYTQLVSRSSTSQPFIATATIRCDRWCEPDLTTRSGSANALWNGGNSSYPYYMVPGTDTSTPTNTIQQFTASIGGQGEINITARDKRNRENKLAASSGNTNDFKYSGPNGETFEFGGNPAYVRKIFAGNGYGNNGKVDQNNPDGCTMNGSDSNPTPDCTSDIWWPTDEQNGDAMSPKGKSVTVGLNGSTVTKGNNTFGGQMVDLEQDSGGRNDSCVYGLGACGSGQGTKTSQARDRHVNSGAGGGCARSAPNCLTPRNAPALPYWGWDAAGASNAKNFKIYFDHVSNVNIQTESFLYYLSELRINGEAIRVPQRPYCDDSANVSPNMGQISVDYCREIAGTYAQFGADAYNSNQYYHDWKGFVKSDSRYVSERRQALGLTTDTSSTATTQPPLTYTFTKGPNAGTRISVRLVNMRIAGEFKGMIDDMGPNVDYSGYCDDNSKAWDNRLRDVYRACGPRNDGDSKGLLWSTRYEVTVISPMAETTTVEAKYYNTANSRYTASGVQGVYSNPDTTPDNISIWGDNTRNHNSQRFESICTGGEAANGKQGCSFVYAAMLNSSNGQGVARLKFRNGWVPGNLSGTNTVHLNTGTNTVQSSNLQSGPPASVTSAFAGVNSRDARSLDKYAWVQFPINSYSSYSATPSHGSWHVSRQLVQNFSVDSQVRNYKVEYLDSTCNQIEDLQGASQLNVVSNSAMPVARPKSSVGEGQFAGWKLVWRGVGTSSDNPCGESATKLATDSDGNIISGSDYTNILPGSTLDINSVYLTSPKADYGWNSTHLELALVPVFANVQENLPVYEVVQELGAPANSVYKTVRYFTGVPGLVASKVGQWWDALAGQNITENNIQYSYNEARSMPSARLAVPDNTPIQPASGLDGPNNFSYAPLWLFYSSNGMVVNRMWVVDGTALGINQDPQGYPLPTFTVATGDSGDTAGTWGEFFRSINTVALAAGSTVTLKAPSPQLSQCTVTGVDYQPTADGTGAEWTSLPESGASLTATGGVDSYTVRYTVNCQSASLTLVRIVDGLPEGPTGQPPITGADITAAALATADDPTTEIADPSDVGGVKTYDEVDPNTYYLTSAIAKKENSDEYKDYFLKPTPDNWVCIDTENNSPVAVGDNFAVTVGQNQKVRCTIHYATAKILTTAKIIPNGVAEDKLISLDDVRIRVQALGATSDINTNEIRYIDIPPNYFTGFMSVNSVGYTQKCATTGDGCLLRVDPATQLSLQPMLAVTDSDGSTSYKNRIGGYYLTLQVFNGGHYDPEKLPTPANMTIDSNWTDLEPARDIGPYYTVQIPQGRVMAYRLLLKPVPSTIIPMTGGRPADLFVALGALIALISAVAATVKYRKARPTQQEVRS